VFVDYQPEGSAEPTRYEFNAKRIRASTAALLESLYRKLSGGNEVTLDAIWLGASQGNATAVRVVLWHCLSQTHATLRIEDVDPYMGEVEVHFSAGELDDLRVQVARNKRMSEAQKEAYLGELEALAVGAEPSEAEGKAPSSDSSTSTG
jgi:hypothetical protein